MNDNPHEASDGNIYTFPSNVRFSGMERLVQMLVRRELRRLIDTGEWPELEPVDEESAAQWRAALEEAFGDEPISTR